jgi:hypothetical protein
MKIAIQIELEDACKIKKYLPSDILELYLDIASLYSKKSWLCLQDEFLTRMEQEKAII